MKRNVPAAQSFRIALRRTTPGGPSAMRAGRRNQSLTEFSMKYPISGCRFTVSRSISFREPFLSEISAPMAILPMSWAFASTSSLTAPASGSIATPIRPGRRRFSGATLPWNILVQRLRMKGDGFAADAVHLVNFLLVHPVFSGDEDVSRWLRHIVLRSPAECDGKSPRLHLTFSKALRNRMPSDAASSSPVWEAEG